MRYLTFGLGYILLYVVIAWALGGHPLAREIFGNAGLVSSALLVIVVIVRRRREWYGCQRLFWDTIAIGMALWVIGHLGWAFDAFVLKSPTWLQWHTVFSLCGGIAPLVALLAQPSLGVRRAAVAARSIDLTSYALLAVFIYSYFVLVPSLVPDARDEAQAKLLLLVHVNRLLLLAGMAVVIVIARSTEWRLTYVRFAIGIAIGFFLRLVTSSAIARGEYQVGSFYDLAWITPWLGYAWAALEAPASTGDESDAAGRVPSAVLTAIPVLLIPAIGYAVLQMQSMGAPVDSFRSLLTSLTTVCGLGLLTLRLAMQGEELNRADARVRLLAAAIEQTGDLILITRADGAYEHANEAFVRALGYTRSEIATLGPSQLVEAGDGPLADQIFAEVRAHGIWRGIVRRRRKDGSAFPASCTVVPLKEESGRITHFVGVERDMTEELRLRDQLVHTERLSAIGELVAGVAHEINNPLQTIIGSVELMLVDGASPRDRDLELVRREAARAGHIVRNLLSFVRRSAPDRTPADLNQIVRATVELREYHLQQSNISLKAQYSSASLPVLANRDEIQQVIVNLLLNAEQAIASSAGAGTITIRTLAVGTQQIVEIEDDGTGITAELRGRIFEPFFTTKDVGEGTGLGLSISHGVAAAHGGSLDLCDTSKGACFRLTLPAYPPLPAREPSGPPAVPSGELRALVVDDEAPIRKLLARLLERRGFEVREAETADAALALATDLDPGLVLCDVRMPGMTGFDLYRRLSEQNPALVRRFIFITGDTTSEYTRAGFDHVPVLAKPFTAADLDAVLALRG